MTKTTKLVWRLKESPTSENLRELVKDGILNKDEARQILFSSEEQEDRDKESLKSEIKFLRELVEKLANKGQIIQTIREIEVPVYKRWDWWKPYETWCCRSDGNAGSSTLILGTNNSTTDSITTIQADFSDIKTF